MTEKKWDAILFDMNGVLVNDELYHYEAFRRVLGDLGYNLTLDEYSIIGLGARDEDFLRGMVSRIPQANDADEEGIHNILRAKSDQYANIVAEKGVPWMEGAQELIFSLKEKGYHLALATGAIRREAEMILDGLHSKSLFEVILAAEDIQQGKPDPECYLMAAEMLNVPTDRSLVIEDSVLGVQSACNAQMDCVGITTTYTKDDLSNATYLVDHLDEIIETAGL